MKSQALESHLNGKGGGLITNQQSMAGMFHNGSGDSNSIFDPHNSQIRRRPQWREYEEGDDFEERLVAEKNAD